MLLDAGIATIWRGRNTAEPGYKPVMVYDCLYFQSYYGEKTVGITRYWTAQAHDGQADVLVEIQRNAGISTGDRCQLCPYYDSAQEGYYKILQVQQVTDEDGQPMTDLTLERIDAIDEP